VIVVVVVVVVIVTLGIEVSRNPHHPGGNQVSGDVITLVVVVVVVVAILVIDACLGNHHAFACA